MRLTQILGLFFAVAGFLLSTWVIGDTDAGTPTTSTSAGVFMGLMIFALPCFVISAILLVPSTILLLFAKERNIHGFHTKKWQLLLAVNLVISLRYIYIIMSLFISL